MRVFFALEPDADCNQRIAHWRDQALPGFLTPVPAANFHLTLAFIGEITPADLDRLCTGVDERFASRSPPPGRLLLDRLGYWPTAQLVWVGSSQWPADLETLALALRHGGQRVGARAERRAFQPHVTLARHCELPPQAPLSEPAIDFPYQHFVLFESVRGKQGVHYQALAHWTLQTALQRPRRR